MLTGAPSVGYAPDDPGTWAALLEAERRGFPMMAGTLNLPWEDAERSVGLIEGHAYSVLNAREVGAPQST